MPKKKMGWGELMPWDLSYYAELYRQEYMEYDEERGFTPILRTRQCSGGYVEGLASDLYRLEFERNTELLPYRAEVEVCNVSSHGTHVGTLMMDCAQTKTLWCLDDQLRRAYGNVRPVVTW